ncbi:MAG: hypothetical protein RR365_08980 [Bacteroides sp.]
MTNPERKKAFIDSLSESLRAQNLRYLTFFSDIEDETGRDLAELRKEEIGKIISANYGLLTSSKNLFIGCIKRYLVWSRENGYVDSIPDIGDTCIVQEDAIREKMVSSPLHLQMQLNKVFHPEKYETIDCVGRAYLWMAFIGIRQGESLRLKNGQVDLVNREITIGVNVFDMPKEALLSITQCVTLKSFNSIHPLYGQLVTRSRVESDIVLRGIKAMPTVCGLNATVIKKETDYFKPSYNTIRLSGMFYRTFNRERADQNPNFYNLALELSEGKDVSARTIKRKTVNLQKDYEEWKNAFRT